jgi:Fe2+ or Zn2+ uptake regulation protein
VLDRDLVSRQLRSRGLRLTRQRRAVLDVVAEAQAGVSPTQVYDAARRRCPELGLTTVYRTLDLLDTMGVLRRVHGSDHCESFTAAEADHGHTVVCSACGRVSEFTDCDMSPVVRAAARQTGFAISDHFLQLTGTCAACGAAPSAAPPEKGTRGDE